MEVDGARWCSVGLFRLADLHVQRAKAKVAVACKRAHAEFVGGGEGMAVVDFGRFAIRKVTPRCELAGETQGICLIATLLGLKGTARARSARPWTSSTRPANR
jgi:hypothetical protein